MKVLDLARIADRLFCGEAWSIADAPCLSEEAEHVNLRAIHPAIGGPAYSHVVRLIDLARCIVLVRRHRENAVDNAGVEGHDRVRIAGPCGCGEAGEVRRVS